METMTDTSHIIDPEHEGRSFLSIEAMPEKELATYDIPFEDHETERRRAMILEMQGVKTAVRESALEMASHFAQILVRLPSEWRDVVCGRLQGKTFEQISADIASSANRNAGRIMSVQQLEFQLQEAMKCFKAVEILFTSKVQKRKRRMKGKMNLRNTL